MSDVLRKAEALYRGEGLALPPIDDAAAGALRALDGSSFATRSLAWSLYDFNPIVDELASGHPPPYVAFGFSGHGFDSQAVHYYAIDDRLAFLMQLRWGSAHGDAEADRKRYHGLIATAATLRRLAGDAVDANRFPAGMRMVVAQSSFHGSRWAWVSRPGDGQARQWQSSRDLAPIAAAIELRRLVEGAAAA